MKFIARFWNDVKSSFYNPTFYAHLKNRTVGSGIKNILFLNVLLGVVFTTTIILFAIPAFKEFEKKNYAETYYPQELTITIKDGVASSTVSEPYFIKSNAEFKIDNNHIQNYLVVNTQKDLSLNTIASYKSLFVLTRESLIVQESETQTRTYSLASVKDLVISKEKVTAWQNEFLFKLKQYAVPIALVFLIMFVVGVSLYWLCVMLVWAFVPILVAKLQKKKLTYKESYVIGLYAVFPVIVVSAVLMIFGVGFGGLTSLLLFALILVINIGKETTELEDSTIAD